MNIPIKFALEWGKDVLKENNINTQDAEFIMSEILGERFKRDRNNGVLKIREERFFSRAIKQRLRHVPLDKIIGYTDFMGVRIPFSRSVLTPRQETEIMVDDIIRAHKGTKPMVLDLCSGSGCIGLSVAKALDTQVVLADISKKAIRQSKKNAKLNGINVTILHSDLFDNIPTKFDIIISNPPYIKRKDLEDLEIEVKDFDPMISLDGGERGLEFYKKIIAEAPKYLNKNGTLYLEIGINQSDDIVEMLKADFESVTVKKDFAGIDRYIIAKKRERDVK